MVADQPASIGALPLAVARDAGCRAAYLPGLTMRRITDGSAAPAGGGRRRALVAGAVGRRDLYPGEAETDARDAFITADAARAMPHTLRTTDLADETVAELAMISGFDDDLAGESTRTVSAASSPRSTRPWNESSDLESSTRPCSDCWTSPAPRPRSAKPDAVAS